MCEQREVLTMNARMRPKLKAALGRMLTSGKEYLRAHHRVSPMRKHMHSPTLLPNEQRKQHHGRDNEANNHTAVPLVALLLAAPRRELQAHWQSATQTEDYERR